ncbi:lysophospholipid acyltransferase family protein [Roseibium marinum]|uniref:KDO2-lipid IV(A) lauroyltransferase n=1 Tax=Roseibium marinum TaxID=281252 RepID=A0A2S3UNW2_9HYPH|nr:lysophospholipid acyltransferase family protein [Roseibium marinum]POF29233.1 KDO2-lipid IV(A) lauroyltransferase [Roseibium marinum]
MKKPARLEDIPFRQTLAEEPDAPPLRELLSNDQKRRDRARLYWLRHSKDGVLNTIFHSGLKRCPAEFVSGFGKAITPLVRWSYRNKLFPNRIKRNFSELTQGGWRSETEEEAGLHSWWQNVGRSISEFSIVNRLWKNSHIEIEGLENLEAARNAGGPLIFTSMHLGTWEALFVAIHEGLAGPSIGPFQPEPNRFKNRIVHAIRKERNQYLFPPGQRSAYLLRRLMATGQYSMTIFIDEVRDKQVHLPLFGRKLPDKGNAVVAVKLANTCGGTLVPTYLARTGPARFKLVILPGIERPGPQLAYEIPDTIKELNRIFEPVVLDHIEEWYMLGELRLPQSFHKTPYAKQLARKNAEKLQS